jgi:spore germination protein GerM
MSRRILVVLAMGVIAALAIAAGWWAVASFSARRAARAQAVPAVAASPAAGPDARKITATLYFVSDDGMELVGIQREVPFGETVIDQAKQIVTSQLAVAPAPLVSAIPPETALRALYLTERGDAFVDLSADARTRHPGGALDELFTVYTIVNALTTNLPAVKRVQILIEGKEVDTLAGHVDLRHPLQKNLKWVRAEKGDT